MAKSDANPESEQTFESALARLETIVCEMDSPTVPLEQLIRDYEEGVRLVKVCQTKLQEAEQKIEIITRRAHGEVELAPFDAAKPAEAPAKTKKNAQLF